MAVKRLFLFYGLMISAFFVAAQQPSPIASRVAGKKEDISDSIKEWQKDRGFRYMKDIDSILRSRSDLKSDTLHLNDNGRVTSRRDSRLNQFLNIPIVTKLLTILAIGFILFIVYKILLTAGFFNKKRRKIPARVDEELENVESPQLGDLIAKSEEMGDYGRAVRYRYLLLLRLLAAKNLIHLSNEKTNLDYIKEVRAHSFQEDFREITRYYEYIWYGEFTPDPYLWERVKSSFIQLTNKIDARY